MLSFAGTIETFVIGGSSQVPVKLSMPLKLCNSDYTQSIDVKWNMHQHHEKYCLDLKLANVCNNVMYLYKCTHTQFITNCENEMTIVTMNRGGSRAAATSKMECFVIIVAAALDLPPMNAVIVIFVNMVMLDLD